MGSISLPAGCRGLFIGWAEKNALPAVQECYVRRTWGESCETVFATSEAIVRFWVGLAVLMMWPSLGWAAGPRITVDGGVLEGKREGTVNEFLGIPYGAAPTGEMRWKPPVPAAKWSGVRKATSFGPRCMQGLVYEDMIFRDPGPSEDCLTLNVWVPAGFKGKLPVMVWIYGGGFVAGGTSEPRQDGRNLAKLGVVVVSMNYRLGIFGFFTHPDLAAESEKKAAGNYGLLDQLLALEWVHSNIAAFGGDPKNVTIFGESAGSFSVSALMASPLAKGRFQKAIGESGAAFLNRPLPFKSVAEKEAEDEKFTQVELGTNSLAALRALPASQLLKPTLKKKDGELVYEFRPDVDGYFLPEAVREIFRKGKQSDVPILAGWNHDEKELTEDEEKDPAIALKREAASEFGERAAEFLKLYPGTSKVEALRSLKDYKGDDFIAWSTWNWMEAQKKSGKQLVYRYRFDQSLPAPDKPEGLGAYHSGEIEYVFGQLDSKHLPWRVEDRKLSAEMQKYWTNFARTGDPNGPGLPQWQPYGEDGWQVMRLGSPLQAHPDDLRARYLFLDQVWIK